MASLYTLVLSCLVVLAVGGRPNSQSLPTLDPNLPPIELWGSSQSGAFWESGGIRTNVRYDTLDSSVTFERIYAPSVIPSATIATHYQRVPTSYWPTAIRAVDSSHLLVAGKGKRAPHNTILELWTFSTGTIPPPVPGGVSGGGTVNYVWTLPVLSSVDELFRTSVASQSVVSAIFVNKGIAGNNSLLLQFFSSKDLYYFDVATSAMTLLASPLTTTAPYVVPSLAQPNDTFWAANHSTLGFLYMLQVRDPEPPQTPPCIVLRDSDRNGTIDSVTTYTVAQWITAGLSDSSVYLEHYY